MVVIAVDNRVVRARQAALASVDRHPAFVGPDGAAEDAHQGRFAGAVLADQRMDFAGQHLEIDAVERRGRPEALANGVGAGRHVVHAHLLSLRNRITEAKNRSTFAIGDAGCIWMIFEADFPALSKKAVKPIIGPRGVAHPRCPFGLGLGRYSGAAPRATPAGVSGRAVGSD